MTRICLTMIVRNETLVLRECLNSVLKHIDLWCICDTGSTDGTPDFIESYFSSTGKTGELHRCEWKDFGHNRTEAFRKARALHDRDPFDYYFVMDADDVFCTEDQQLQALPPDLDSYFIELRSSRTRFLRQQLFTTRLAWRYVGILHEYPTCDCNGTRTANLTGCHIQDGRRGARSTGVEASHKYARDAAILLQGLRDEPTNERYCFYLAQSYYDAHNYAMALYFYKKRALMGGWGEEVYYSLFRFAAAKHHITGIFPEDAYLEAFRQRPTRLEALFSVLLHHYDAQRYAQAFQICSSGMGSSLVKCEDLLFVDSDIHEHRFADLLAVCAFYSGHRNIARRLHAHLLAVAERGALVDKVRIRRNLSFCAAATAQSVCIYPGYSAVSYNGASYSESCVGGAEIAVVKLAEALTQMQCEVSVCGHNIVEGLVNGVYYAPVQYLHDLLELSLVDVVIVSRYTHFFTEFRNTAPQTFLWLHDVSPLAHLNFTSFTNSGYDLLHNVRHTLSGIVCLTNHHARSIQEESRLPKSLFAVIGNALNNEDYAEVGSWSTPPRIRHFIHTSAQERSLGRVLKLFADLHAVKTDVSLTVCGTVTGELHELAKTTPGVTLVGRVPHQKMPELFSAADAWIHIPESFCETYCISALEAQRSGCVCFVTDVGALPEVVGERGIVLKPADVSVDTMLRIVQDEALIEQKRSAMCEWASQQTWAHRAEEWTRLFKPEGNETAALLAP